MERIGCEIDGGHLRVGDDNALRVFVGIDPAGNVQSGFGRGGTDQLQDDLVAEQWLAAPVLGDEGEQPVFDAVPLASTSAQGL